MKKIVSVTPPLRPALDLQTVKSELATLMNSSNKTTWGISFKNSRTLQDVITTLHQVSLTGNGNEDADIFTKAGGIILQAAGISASQIQTVVPVIIRKNPYGSCLPELLQLPALDQKLKQDIYNAMHTFGGRPSDPACFSMPIYTQIVKLPGLPAEIYADAAKKLGQIVRRNIAISQRVSGYYSSQNNSEREYKTLIATLLPVFTSGRISAADLVEATEDNNIAQNWKLYLKDLNPQEKSQVILALLELKRCDFPTVLDWSNDVTLTPQCRATAIVKLMDWHQIYAESYRHNELMERPKENDHNKKAMQDLRNSVTGFLLSLTPEASREVLLRFPKIEILIDIERILSSSQDPSAMKVVAFCRSAVESCLALQPFNPAWDVFPLLSGYHYIQPDNQLKKAIAGILFKQWNQLSVDYKQQKETPKLSGFDKNDPIRHLENIIDYPDAFEHETLRTAVDLLLEELKSRTSSGNVQNTQKSLPYSLEKLAKHAACPPDLKEKIFLMILENNPGQYQVKEILQQPNLSSAVKQKALAQYKPYGSTEKTEMEKLKEALESESSDENFLAGWMKSNIKNPEIFLIGLNLISQLHDSNKISSACRVRIAEYITAEVLTGSESSYGKSKTPLGDSAEVYRFLLDTLPLCGVKTQAVAMEEFVLNLLQAVKRMLPNLPKQSGQASNSNTQDHTARLQTRILETLRVAFQLPLPDNVSTQMLLFWLIELGGNRDVLFAQLQNPQCTPAQKALLIKCLLAHLYLSPIDTMDNDDQVAFEKQFTLNLLQLPDSTLLPGITVLKPDEEGTAHYIPLDQDQLDKCPMLVSLKSGSWKEQANVPIELKDCTASGLRFFFRVLYHVNRAAICTWVNKHASTLPTLSLNEWAIVAILADFFGNEEIVAQASNIIRSNIKTATENDLLKLAEVFLENPASKLAVSLTTPVWAVIAAKAWRNAFESKLKDIMEGKRTTLTVSALNKQEAGILSLAIKALGITAITFDDKLSWETLGLIQYVLIKAGDVSMVWQISEKALTPEQLLVLQEAFKPKKATLQLTK